MVQHIHSTGGSMADLVRSTRQTIKRSREILADSYAVQPLHGRAEDPDEPAPESRGLVDGRLGTPLGMPPREDDG